MKKTPKPVAPKRPTVAWYARELAQVERIAQQWQAAVDAASEAIFVFDGNQIVLRVNRFAAAYLGRAYLEIVGRPILDLLTGPVREGVVAALSSTGPARRLERDIYLARGRRWIALTLDPVADERRGIRGAVLSLRDITRQKSAEAKVRRLLERQREISAHMESVREEERGSIAREVHDELGHSLTALKIDLAWVGQRLPEAGPEIAERLKAMRELVDQTIGVVRRVASELRPSLLDSFGLLAALEWKAEETARRSGLVLEFRAAGEEPSFPAATRTAIYRIFQETLTNVVRHAAAKRLEVRVGRKGRQFEMIVRDDGRGFVVAAARARGGFGLGGLAERAMQIGGALTIRSRRGRGTTVRLEVPVGEAAKAGVRR